MKWLAGRKSAERLQTQSLEAEAEESEFKTRTYLREQRKVIRG